MPAPDPRPTVAIWRDEWLAYSETFIRDHVRSLREWRPVTLGQRQLNHAIMEPDFLTAPWAGTRRLRPLANALSGGLEGITGRPAFLGRGARFIRREGASVLHAHFGTSAPAALYLAEHTGAALVVTFHGYDATQMLTGPGADRYRSQLRRLFARASLVLANSDFIRQRLLAAGAPADRLRLHYLGIELRPLLSAPRRQGICFVGRLREGKGLRDLLQAVDALPPPWREVPVTVVGDGPLRRELEEWVRPRGLRVHFMGTRSSEELPAILADHAVFVGPSRTTASGWSEAFGLVYLEAAMQELPVVAYRHGGVGEAVADGETGLLVDEGDINALSESLRYLLEDPAEAARLGRAGRARVVESFDIARQARSLEELYREAADLGAE